MPSETPRSALACGRDGTRSACRNHARARIPRAQHAGREHSRHARLARRDESARHVDSRRWIATDAGPALAADVALVNTYVRDRSAIGSDVLVQAAVAQTLAIGCTVRALGGRRRRRGGVEARARRGRARAPARRNALLLAAHRRAANESLGVRNVDVSSLTLSIDGGASLPLTGDWTLTGPQYVAVPGLHSIVVPG